jgi:hypothetical protein
MNSHPSLKGYSFFFGGCYFCYELVRLVCEVYADNNETHYLNVNKPLIENGLAEIEDFDNEFDPYA